MIQDGLKPGRGGGTRLMKTRPLPPGCRDPVPVSLGGYAVMWGERLGLAAVTSLGPSALPWGPAQTWTCCGSQLRVWGFQDPTGVLPRPAPCSLPLAISLQKHRQRFREPDRPL